MGLRGYQKNGIAAALQELENHRSVLLVAPTGAGKGTMIAHMATTEVRRGPVLVLAHRREIVLDLADRIRERGPRVGVVMRHHPADWEAPVQVASVQSMVRLPTYRFRFVVTDEAHHYLAEEWRGVVERQGAARVVGLTATPQRSDGKPLGDMYEKLIDVVSYEELLRRRYLVPCRVLRPAYRLEGGLAQEPYAAYLKHAEGRRAFMYTSTIAAAKRQVRLLKQHGVPAVGIYADTDPLERADALEALREGTLQVVVNVETMTEGVDVPEVSCVVLARECAYAGAYVQCTGRSLRPAPGKENALLLDLAGSSYRHGHPTAERLYSLQGREPISLARALFTETMQLRAYTRRAYEVQDLELQEYSEDSQRKGGARSVFIKDLRFGQEPDTEIAKRTGLSVAYVQRLRTRAGIPRFDPTRVGRERTMADPELGKVSDNVIAARYGVSVAVVFEARKRLGIPSFMHTEIAAGRPAPWMKGRPPRKAGKPGSDKVRAEKRKLAEQRARQRIDEVKRRKVS